jgi:riboflavin kinase/FMN adenylyltransferase
MRIFRHYSDILEECRHAVVALGNFDGVHKGHQALIAQARDIARRSGAIVGVLAFEPHPQEFFHPQAECFRLTPFRTKARLVAQNGADVLYALAFDAEMARKTAEQFVRNVLVEGLGVRAVVVGADFQFGKGRTGNVALLGEFGKSLGFAVDVFAPVIARGSQKISSTEVREALKAGNPERAAELLGHWWTIEARVEQGDGRGRLLGFPTANMRLDGYLKPAFGIYSVRATLIENEKPVATYDGVANLGVRPMFEANAPLLETYLFDFSGDLYGRHLAVELVAYLRPERKFESLEKLKDQMTQDCLKARASLDRVATSSPA